ncbi:MAG: CocE/NonD family hydrolase, partial [Chloroflexota bacterium]
MTETAAVFDVSVSLDLMAPMRDGVRLAADVYRPARNGEPLPGAFPTLLLRTPYDKRDPNARRQYGEFWARRGYISVLQDCRGCYASEGELYFLRQEADDGYDTMVWLKEQPWCNGRVGTHGYSYMAWAQTALANLNPPALAAMWPSMAGSHAYTSSVRHGGALELRFLCWAFWHAALNTNRALKQDAAVERALNAVDIREILRRLPVREGASVLALAPPYQRWLLDIFTKADYSSYWQHPALGFSEHWDRHADVPVYITGGWYDSYPRAAFENFNGLSARKRSMVKLLMGPWTHGDVTMEQSFAGDVEFGPEAALPSVPALQQRWFDHCLKGENTGIDREPPIKLFVMGGGDGHRSAEGRFCHGGVWRAEQEWPLARTRFTGFFLHGGDRLAQGAPSSPAAASEYVFDPEHPVPTIGGSLSSLHALRELKYTDAELRLVPRVLRVEPIVAAGGYDQRERVGLFGAGVLGKCRLSDTVRPLRASVSALRRFSASI